VVKPSRSVTDAGAGERDKHPVRYARDGAELEQALASLPAHAYPVLLQQRVIGPGVGIFLLLWNGRIAATFAHRRIREKPPAGGVSVYRESIPADPDLVARSRALLDRFQWNGVAMIEYKLDAATGTPYLMEINGRFWGSLQLAIDAGVDFPRLLVALALGEEVAAEPSYRPGVRSRWWLGDVDQLLTRLRRSPEELALPPGSPGPWAALRDFLVLWRPGDRSEILRMDDPAPALRELAEWAHGR
jgi:predicted ATP-grasp superfamily ATP-dependent carboligase